MCLPHKTAPDRFIVIEEVKATQRQKLNIPIKPRTDYKLMEFRGEKVTFHRIIRNGTS